MLIRLVSPLVSTVRHWKLNKTCVNPWPSISSTSTPVPLVVVQISRALHYSSTKYEIFNIQDEDDFKKRVIETDKPVIVDFYAKWCGPCKLLTPRLETAVAMKEGQVHLAKVDIDENAEIAMHFDVGAVPSVLALSHGIVKDKFVGLQDDDKIASFVDNILGD